MKTTIEHKFDTGRLVNGEAVPLHLRIDTEDGFVVRTALGIEQKGEKVSWQLIVNPKTLIRIGALLIEAGGNLGYIRAQ